MRSAAIGTGRDLRRECRRPPRPITPASVALLVVIALALRPTMAQASGQPARHAGAPRCSDTLLVPSARNLRAVAAATLCLVNRERVAHHERPLRANARLASVAQRHCASMVSENYLEHVAPDGSTPMSRVEASGYVSGREPEFEVAENIGWGAGPEATPASAVSRWMGSRVHREDILTRSFRDTGIGVVPGLPAFLAEEGDGAVYTEEFGFLHG